MTDPVEPMERLVFDAQRLMAEHPPILHHRNKRVVQDVACPAGCAHRGQIRYSRWRAMGLPERVDAGGALGLVEGRENVYDYAPVAGEADAVEWHVNFADPHLFVAYGSHLFAQDEMQVAEHPALGALKEALDAGGHAARTVENGEPTPVIVMGVERRCCVATDPNAAEGRPEGLYGNAFARAGEDAVRRATRRLDPPAVTNFIAMAAPAGGHGRYERQTIERILTTAFSGFEAAKLETARFRGKPSPVVAHSGFWGCGAFGGHRVLMAMLQVLAAQMAALDRLAFHTRSRSGTKALDEARKMIERDLADRPALDTPELVKRISAMGFEWGVSDGN